MELFVEKTKELLKLMGFPGAEVNADETHHRISIVISDHFLEENAGTFLPAIDHVITLMLKQAKLPLCVIDVNYYRKERERLITELARAAAKKAVVTKTEVELPPMNSYERRLVHMEIITHPELKTESAGIGKDRHVVIKKVEE